MGEAGVCEKEEGLEMGEAGVCEGEEQGKQQIWEYFSNFVAHHSEKMSGEDKDSPKCESWHLVENTNR